MLLRTVASKLRGGCGRRATAGLVWRSRPLAATVSHESHKGFKSCTQHKADAAVAMEQVQGDAAAPEGESVHHLTTAEWQTFAYRTFEERVAMSPDTYSSSTVNEHTPEEEGRYYRIPQSTIEGLPAGLTPKCLAEEFEMNEHYMMVRRPAWDLVQHMKNITSNAPGNVSGSVLGVHGRQGGGKTSTLHYCSQYALENSWLVLGCGGRDFPNDLIGLIQPNPSEKHEGIFDQPGFTQAFFTRLLEQKNVLDQVTLKKQDYEYEWSPKPADDEDQETYEFLEYGEEPKTLYDMVKLASHDITQAPVILYDFIWEIDNIKEVPVLVVIDSINEWDNASPFPDPADPSKKLASGRLAMVDAFSPFQTRAPGHGISLFAATSSTSQRMMQKRLAEASFSIRVDGYSDPELKQCVTHYNTSGMLSTHMDVHLLAHFKGLTGGVPREVLNLAWLV